MSAGSRRSLVYAYGCGEPISGLDHALAEHERCTQMWDQLVEIDRVNDRLVREAAMLDVPAMQVRADEIERLSEHLASQPKDAEARTQRRNLYREQRADLYAWMKTHREAVKEFDRRRLVAVVACRQQAAQTIFWSNYNRVILSYTTGRAVARQKGGRLIRPHDESRDDLVCAAQIQRTHSGLGAAPGELQDGTVSMLQIGRVDSRAYDPSVGRCECDRLCRVIVEMRVDQDGHTIRLPVWVHRPLPEGCRVKAAQIVRRPRGDWRLCLTLDTPTVTVPDTASASPMRLTLDWHANGVLTVLRAADGATWTLPERWWRGMDRIERLHAWIGESLERARAQWGGSRILGPVLAMPTLPDVIAHGHPKRIRLTDEQLAWWRDIRCCDEQLREGRSNLLDQRRDHYRLIAREVVRRYPAIEIDDRNLAQIATAERGEDRNSLRHRVAPHLLRAEIIHQATKIGLPVLASARVVNASKDRKSSSWARRREGKSVRLAGTPATP